MNALRAMMPEAAPVQLKAGQQVFAPGHPCTAYLVVQAGVVRVSTMTEGGREVVLYRVAPGEACVVTTTCLLEARDYDAYGVAETDVEGLALAKPAFDALLAGSADFRRFVFAQFGTRLRDLIVLVQEVADRQVDRRLARFLAERAGDGDILMTHQAIAAELGTAREVVSRLLKDFAARGLLEAERGRIVIRDRQALSRLTDGL